MCVYHFIVILFFIRMIVHKILQAGMAYMHTFHSKFYMDAYSVLAQLRGLDTATVRNCSVLKGYYDSIMLRSRLSLAYIPKIKKSLKKMYILEAVFRILLRITFARAGSI